MSACTEDDHDTTDPYCGACGDQLSDGAVSCSTCDDGEHDSPCMPFCPCCGSMNFDPGAVGVTGEAEK